MKYKALPVILLTFLLMSGSAFSQTEDDKIRFHIAPYNLFDPVTGVLQLGIQKNIQPRFALALDHGFKMQTFRNLISDIGSDRKDHKYSKTKAELKYFVGEKGAVPHSYLSMEGMYFPQKYRKENEYLSRNNTYYRYTYSNINRTVWVAGLKYGVEVKASNFVFDYFFGLGIRRLSIEHEAADLIEVEYYAEQDVWFPPIDRKEGVFYRPHVSLGIKAGYIIR